MKTELQREALLNWAGVGDLNVDSLDVLRGFEKKLTQVQYNDYRIRLECRHGHEAISVSAPQRREALLRTLGLWK